VCVTCQSTALDRPMSSGEESNFLSHGDSASAMTDNLSGETVNAIIDGVVAKLREAPRFTMEPGLGTERETGEPSRIDDRAADPERKSG